MNPKNEERKEKIYGIIKSFAEENGIAPSYGEIAKAAGCSKPLVAKYVSRLTDEGAVFKDRRGRVFLPGRVSVYTTIPVLGVVACGKPILAVDDILGYVPIDPLELGGGEFFALKAEGYSMINVGIAPDDVVYVRRQETADEGQIVVAMIDSEEGDGSFATLKRFFRDRKNGGFILRAENDAMEDIHVKDLRIIGVAVRVLKRL